MKDEVTKQHVTDAQSPLCLHVGTAPSATSIRCLAGFLRSLPTFAHLPPINSSGDLSTLTCQRSVPFFIAASCVVFEC